MIFLLPLTLTQQQDNGKQNREGKEKERNSGESGLGHRRLVLKSKKDMIGLDRGSRQGNGKRTVKCPALAIIWIILACLNSGRISILL